jgi:hypothetical protein
MNYVDESRLESDVVYRYHYLADFIGFSAEDVEIIHSAADFLAPKVPALVEAVYAKLYMQDATWRHFFARQHGYEGEIPKTLEALTPDHPQIQFRKAHLARYLERLVSKPYDESMIKYLDMVGKIHTPDAGNATINVPLVQMNALLGFVADAFNATILESQLAFDTKVKAARAFSKLLWIQNDLIQRHYGTRT